MRNNLYNNIGYYSWLIPSCISSLLSIIIILNNIFKKKTLLVKFQTLYCLGDLLQCCAWFIGPLYTLKNNSSNLCSKQEIIFEIGLFIKTSIAVLVSGLFASYTTSRENFKMSKIKIFFFVVIIYTLISIILSYIFESHKAGCEGILDHKYSQVDRYELSYLLTFVVPISFYMIITVIFASIGLYNRKDDLSSALLTPIYDGLKMCLVIVTLALIPCLTFFVILSFGRMNIILYCITGVIISSTGTLFSCYHLYAPYLNKTHRFNLFFFLEILSENLSNNSDGRLMSLSRSSEQENPLTSDAYSNSPSTIFEIVDPNVRKGRILSISNENQSSNNNSNSNISNDSNHNNQQKNINHI